MNNTAALPVAPPEQAAPLDLGPTSSRMRTKMTRRLQDVVTLPSSRITPQERHMAADLLIEVLRESDHDTRLRCAQRMAGLAEVSALLLRYLGRDDIEIAKTLLEDSEAFGDSDLIFVSRNATLQHREKIARRKRVTEAVADVLLEQNEETVMMALLRNEGADLSHPTLDLIVAASRRHPSFVPWLVKRPELKPSQALAMFWWAAAADRRRIFARFAVERLILLESAGDLFPMAVAEGWSDPLVRKSLQFIERRQRNRGAIDRSPYASLEHAIEAFSQGISREIVAEISNLAGIRPATGAQILGDLGGEPIAILCKATGLKRAHILMLWKAMKRPVGTDEQPSEGLENALMTFDTLSTNKAQTVLRYWNWSLTSAMSPVIASSAEMSGLDGAFEFSTPARISTLVFGE